MNEYFLIVGASGAAGKSAVTACRASGSTKIVATTSREEDIPGADVTFKNKDILKSSFASDIAHDLKRAGFSGSPAALIYTPARGNVGYPIRDTGAEDLREALRFSFDPLLELEKSLSPGFSAGYSAFYWLDHSLQFYGSMGFVKKKMEEWAVEKPERRKIIRGGTFFSQSVRGIAVYLQRLLKKSASPSLQSMKAEYEKSGLNFQDFFLQFAYRHEKEAFQNKFPGQPHSPTTEKSLSDGLTQLLRGEKSPIVSVTGSWIWTDQKMPDLPDFFKEF